MKWVGELDGPPERFFVDHVNEEEGEKEPAEEAEGEAEEADHSSLNPNGLFNLDLSPAHCSENSNVPLPFHHRTIERIDNPKESPKGGDEFKGRGGERVFSCKSFLSARDL